MSFLYKHIVDFFEDHSSKNMFCVKRQVSPKLHFTCVTPFSDKIRTNHEQFWLKISESLRTARLHKHTLVRGGGAVLNLLMSKR